MELTFFQLDVRKWVRECFGSKLSMDKRERALRFLEEAVELVQVGGLSRSEVEFVIDYVYGRPVGIIEQEVGGTMTTLAAFCNAYNLNLSDCANKELVRCRIKLEEIREKNKGKPDFK